MLGGTCTPRKRDGKGKKEELREGFSEFGQSQTQGKRRESERKAEEKAGKQGMKRPKQSNTWKHRESKNIHRRCVYSFFFFWLVKSVCSIGTFYKIDSYDDTH